VTSLTTALDTALSADRVPIFGAVSIALPGYTLRLLDGSGAITFAGGTFVGDDPTYGVLAAVSEITDGASDEAPAVSITILPPNDTAAATLAAPAMQGALVQIYAGSWNIDTGAVVADPVLLFIGEVDVPTLSSGADGRTLEYEVTSISERLFAGDEGLRLSDGFHRSVWSGEVGLANVSGVEQTIYWGTQPPPGTVQPGSSITGGGFGLSGLATSIAQLTINRLNAQVAAAGGGGASSGGAGSGGAGGRRDIGGRTIEK
jgi:hypothetical protein